jgi:hypothetical protein
MFGLDTVAVVEGQVVAVERLVGWAVAGWEEAG